ncbi:hypothetical protein [Chitinophaga filiformis]|uniref:Xylan 1,4-beta-xylosidase n=1 Tax=Chitinophaga filiformis TaxID=104663 RepID=A0A1G7VLS2_CHIFI|nr:hypothetical protein [Chitinophaga filiformis]SDG60359.1 xylan 1,4-beta-xylosidase [Chitinophaga filiformis]
MKNVMLLTFLFAAISGTLIAQTANQKKLAMQERVINIDFNKTAGKLNTMFNECVGAGRANEGLRADWQQQTVVNRMFSHKYLNEIKFYEKNLLHFH